MPYAARAWDTATSKVQCKCGTEFNTNIFQTDDASRCNVNCVNGGTTGCGAGASCCGSGLYFAVYRNDQLLGCYEPPIPGSSLVGSGTYPVQCGSSTAIRLSRTSVIGKTTLSNNPIATARASTGLSFVGGFYNWLGCCPANYLTGVIATLNIPNGQGLSECMVFCSTSSSGGPSTWVSVTALKSGFLVCQCSNTAPNIGAGTRLEYSQCIAPCTKPGDICGGYERQKLFDICGHFYHCSSLHFHFDKFDDHSANDYNEQFYKLKLKLIFIDNIFTYILAEYSSVLTNININFSLRRAAPQQVPRHQQRPRVKSPSSGFLEEQY
ncbi:hypothetical protein IFR05_005553 [Cadophora sp. M221]|nr:hypothetical protein IFR05_005553 [Cadophora sp. M221]